MSDSFRPNPELFADFVAETEELIETLVEDVLLLEVDPGSADLLKRVFRTLHTLKGNAGFLNFTPMVDLSHSAEDQVAQVRAGRCSVTTPLTDGLLLVADMLRNLLDHLRDPSVACPDVGRLIQQLARLAEGPAGVAAPPAAVPVPPAAPGASADTGAPEVPAGEPAPGAEPAPGEPPRAERDSATVRVDVQRIDQIMNQVGELVLERNRLQQIISELRAGKPVERLEEALAENAGRIHSITGELQAALLKVRMVPVERIFRKFPRLVRDLEARLGKQVRLVTTGGDTELDKTVAEAILDPLTHLVRNALDHGIEPPAARRARGKPEEGTLSLVASHEGNHILVRVSDDGAGVDSARVARKAVQMGLVSPERLETMSRTEALDLLFAPGLTTSESVSELSGRGVGLDVVRSRLKAYHGMIELTSEPGRGTQVTLKLPLTLAIVPSLFVLVGSQLYAVPLASVIEVVAEESRQRFVFQGRPVLRWRERVLPLLDLRDLFHSASAPAPPGRKTVIVGLADRQVAFLVDALVGQEEVVIKTLGDYLGRVPGIAGGTVMGDGRVALIVDIPALVGLARGEALAAAA
ncbi:MAG TPA: chemotaxis protein CheA [Candidatus Saccharimonadales bacterium]|nr:chemotaxis protein CheA [Candidatus Saccharimonadales bacterium]